MTRAVNFAAPSAEDLREGFQNDADDIYLRFGNPTVSAAARAIADLEGAAAGLMFASGMGAISTTLLALTRDRPTHIVVQRQVFGQTAQFIEQVLQPAGVDVTWLDKPTPLFVQEALRPETSLVYVETPSNPDLQIVDLVALASVTHARGVLLVVDSTFAGPIAQRPVELGADVVLHSGTKILSGHADVMCGVAAGSLPIVRQLRHMQVLVGNVLDPEAAWLFMRGLRTLPLRSERQAASALAVARFLEADPRVKRVYYPHLPSHTEYTIARTQMAVGGSVVSFELVGGHHAALRLLNALEEITIATSLGGVESVIEIPCDLDFSDEQLGASRNVGLSVGLIRFSVGLEDPADLIRDFGNALKAAEA